MSDTWSSIQAHKKQLDSLRERLQRRRKQDSGHLGEVWGGRGGPGLGERLRERKTAGACALSRATLYWTPRLLVSPSFPPVAETNAHLRESLQCFLPGVCSSKRNTTPTGAPSSPWVPFQSCLRERCVWEASQYPIPRASKTLFVAFVRVLP